MRIRVSTGGEVREEHEIDRELVVGRSSRADIPIRDDEISSRHLALRPADGGVEVEDLGSTNGTMLDGGTRLQPGRPVLLVRGQKLTLGEALLEIVGTEIDGGSAVSSSFGATIQAGPGAGHAGLIAIARFRAATPRLIVAAEHDLRSVDLEEVEVTIGRDAKACQVAIRHQSISGRHAAIRYGSEGFEVRDLGSGNGTFLAEAPVDDWTALSPPAALRFGTVECLFATTPPSAGEDETRVSEALVAHVVAQGRATRHEGTAVLTEHRESGRGVGELLVVRGLLTPSQWMAVYREREGIGARSDGGLASHPTRGGRPLMLLVVVLLVVALVVLYLALR